MRHNKLKKINKKSKHKKLMFYNMLYSIIKNKYISTTISKYKILKKFFDKKVKKIKRNRKFFFSLLKEKKINFTYFLKKIGKKKSGFLRVEKIKQRKGDFSRIIYLKL
ncbi:50S ribosomal protein L17 [Candidatus Vidania fulgoroideae]|uniref:50S ribosomal protein L17 n=1 Tax=Candidatus Vidania fulgoroideorum TaxID=881286 RepID=A0A346E0Q5_9PROT|nr:50S ribosomal protein L17 [Candidatus Vidania fulgoroideae]